MIYANQLGLNEAADAQKIFVYISDDALEVGLGNDRIGFLEYILDSRYRLIVLHRFLPQFSLIWI